MHCAVMYNNSNLISRVKIVLRRASHFLLPLYIKCVSLESGSVKSMSF